MDIILKYLSLFNCYKKKLFIYLLCFFLFILSSKMLQFIQIRKLYTITSIIGVKIVLNDHIVNKCMTNINDDTIAMYFNDRTLSLKLALLLSFSL